MTPHFFQASDPEIVTADAESRAYAGAGGHTLEETADSRCDPSQPSRIHTIDVGGRGVGRWAGVAPAAGVGGSAGSRLYLA